MVIHPVFSCNNHWIWLWHKHVGKYIVVKVVYIAYAIFFACHFTHKVYSVGHVQQVVCLKFFQLLLPNSTKYEELSSFESLYSEKTCSESGFISERLSREANFSILQCQNDVDDQVKSLQYVSFLH